MSGTERLLVGNDTGDDAAVWKLDDANAIVFTADFFTPIVDDPFDWGRIAAANALSDVYAMGGRPVLCLNLVGWPRDRLPLDLLGRVLDGGTSVANDAGAIIAGGHTIDDNEPTYGMAVVGLVEPDRVVTNAAARAGDDLVLTKPIGTGIITTAIKRGSADPAVARAAVETMAALNRDAADSMRAAGIIAATDVTGFGLLGHLHKMLLASGVSATLDPDAVPLIDGAAALAAAGMIPGGTSRNMEFVDAVVDWGSTDAAVRLLLADAQTSGGMLICCPRDAREALGAALRSRGVLAATVGSVEPGDPGRIRLRSGAAR